MITQMQWYDENGDGLYNKFLEAQKNEENLTYTKFIEREYQAYLRSLRNRGKTHYEEKGKSKTTKRN